MIGMENSKKILQSYIDNINNKCLKLMPSINNKQKIKVTNDTMIIPTINTYNDLIYYNYNLTQIKQIAKTYKIKVTGNKKDILNRIYAFLYLSSHIIPIQKKIRGIFVRNYMSLRGPASLNRNLCTNNTDFITMDPLNEIDFHQFMSYEDKDGFIYGFDINSLYNLLIKTGREAKNPYNRNTLPDVITNNMKRIVKISRILNMNLNLTFNDEPRNISYEKFIELKILGLFQNIDALGNYTNASWFLSLNRTQLSRYVRELIDIWNFRAQLSFENKRNICPLGNPFAGVNIHYIMNSENIWGVRQLIVEIMEKMVNTGIDNEYRILGSYYVLGALTLVNEDAATALPWLYQSFNTTELF